MKISILMPFYNEERTINLIIDKIYSSLDQHFDFEIIAVDDGSTDNFLHKLGPYIIRNNFKLIHHNMRKGKGAALQTAFNNSIGDIIIIQDADLEYSPSDYSKLIAPFNNEDNEIVFGYRVHQKSVNSYYLNPFYYGGKLINFYFNLLANKKIKDIHTCFKLARRASWEKLNLKSNGFDFCHEFSAKVIFHNLSFTEVPISYAPRTRKDGKKIKFSDGLLAILTINRHLLYLPKR